MRAFIAIALPSMLVCCSPALADWQLCGHGKRVTCVVDGDTIWSKGEKIRLMGFDTPERANNAKCKRERILADKATVPPSRDPQQRPRVDREEGQGQIPALRWPLSVLVGRTLVGR